MSKAVRLRRAPDPFGIPLSKPWEVFERKRCIMPGHADADGMCWSVVAAFRTEAEAIAAYPNAQPWPSD